MNKTHTPDFGTIPAHIKLWRAGKIADAYLEQENALVLAQVERDRLKAQVEELRGALEAYHEFGIFVALVRGPSGEDIQPRLAEAQIMARDALAKVSQ